jgi:1,2-dihydroxy-3-keto-5-methylthiopentene dioxygenase
MAVVRIPDLDRTIEDVNEIRSFLSERGIDYWQTTPEAPVASDAPADVLLVAYGRQIDELKKQGGYVTADVIDVFPDTPGLDAMLNRFNEGRGVFHVHPPGDTVFAIEVGAGDLIRVPRGTHHWFDLCADRRIRAIRLFQDPSGWTPHYTNTGVDQHFQPLCFGPAYIPPSPGGM